MRRVVLFAISFLVVAASAIAAVSPQKPIDGSVIPRFAQPLPTLSAAPQNGSIMTVAGGRALTLRMCEFRAAVLPPGAVDNYLGTSVWGYLVDPTGTSTCSSLVARYARHDGLIDTFTGPVIVNERGTPTEMTYINDLGTTSSTNLLAYIYSTDRTIHWADPGMPHDETNPCVGEMTVPAYGSPCAQNYEGAIPAVVHLHGGEVPAEIDGGPHAWFTSDGAHVGSAYYSSAPAPANGVVARYPNTQAAAPIWFHDHTLGATRLNVYAGLAGAYVIRDPALTLPAGLQPLNEVIPLVIQDRMFDTNGQLFFPAASINGVPVTPNPNHPYWVPEFTGDTIAVNGKVWPFLQVEPRRYRFLILNGSNARTYEFSLTNEEHGGVPPLWVIGTDGGYLDAPVRIGTVAAARRRAVAARGLQQNTLIIMPGERYEVIVDFASFTPGTRLTLRNSANMPYPDGDRPVAGTTDTIMQFRVVSCASLHCGHADTSWDPSSADSLRSDGQKIVRLADPQRGTLAHGVSPALTRQLTLNEVMAEATTATDPVTGAVFDYEGGPLEVLINNTEFISNGARPYDDFTKVTHEGLTTAFSEIPTEGTTEVWEIVNLTADAHPIHLHLVQMQVLNRQRFDVESYLEAYVRAFPGGRYLQGFGPPLDYRAQRNELSGGKMGGNPDVGPFLRQPGIPPLPAESGWKDTVIAPPGEVTRLVVRWAPTDLPVSAPAASLVYPFDPSGNGGEHHYVWHCHIIDHEDNEMMRPHTVTPSASAPVTRPLTRGRDY